MFTLSNILKINAISSGATGLLLTVFPKFSADLFTVGTQVPFLIVGLFLVIFSLFVAYQAYKKPLDPKQIVSIIWMDRIWVIASLIVVLIWYSSISLAGLSIIIAIAAWVGLMAYLQNAKLVRLA